MAACTPGIDAIDRLLQLLDRLAEVIEEVREHLTEEVGSDDRAGC